MDKQKGIRKAVGQEGAFVDLLNQEMKELQDGMKQKQIEEMVRDINLGFDIAYDSQSSNFPQIIAETLIEKNYRKIPEGAVVLTREQYEKDLAIERELGERKASRVRKETAEKFSGRLKELEEALLDMVVQFCQMGEEGKLKHIFMSAEEQAFDVLDITYGENVADVYERFNKKWDRPIDEICKELTGAKNG